MNRYISQLDQTAAYARLGMPSGGSPTTDFSAANTAASRDRASAFPIGTNAGSTYLPPAGGQATGGYQPGSYNNNPSAQTAQSIYGPTMGSAQPNSPVNPVGPASVYGPPRANPSATAYQPNTPYGAADAPAANPGAAADAAPAYVTNQWVGPGTQVGPPIAEQRASYTAPSGGEFQPPAAGNSSQFPVPRASANTLGPPSTANSAVLGPPSFDVSASSAVMNGPEVGPPSMGPPPRMDVPTMGPPSSGVPPQAPPTAGKQDPPLALDGYCPVTLVEREKWVKGDPKYGAYHRGRTYLFAGPQEQARFLDPAGQDKFAPALSGYDPVKYTEQGALVDGKRVHGVFYHGQVFLFADEAALQQFWTAPERYAPTVRAEQQRSAAMRPGVQR
jgi:protein disulfide-isomerase